MDLTTLSPSFVYFCFSHCWLASLLTILGFSLPFSPLVHGFCSLVISTYLQLFLYTWFHHDLGSSAGTFQLCPGQLYPGGLHASLFKVLELESDCLSSFLLGQKFCLSAYGLFCRSSHTELHRLWIGCYAYPSCEELWVVCACVRRGVGRGKRWRQDTVQNSSWFKATAVSVAMMGKAVAATAADVLNLGFAWSLCVLIKQQVIRVSPSMFLALF